MGMRGVMVRLKIETPAVDITPPIDPPMPKSQLGKILGAINVMTLATISTHVPLLGRVSCLCSVPRPTRSIMEKLK